MMTGLLDDNNPYKISVIVPVYNTEPYLKACIDSILNQDYDHLEVIAVDDGSSDNSLNLLNQMAKQDSRLLVFSQENRGVSAARNLGLSKHTGDFVCFVDADDQIAGDYIRSLLEKMDRVDAVFSNFSFLYPNGLIIPKKARLDDGEYRVEALRDRLIDDGTLTGILFGSACMAMYRSQLIRDNRLRFHETVRKNEDGLFNIEYLLCATCLYVVNHNGYYYRKGDNKKTGVDFSLLEFEKANAILDQYAGRFKNYDQQIARRRVSAIFWESCKILNAEDRIGSIAKKLKAFCHEHLSYKDYRCLNFDSMSKAKRWLIWLLSHRCYVVFSFLMKHILPFFYSKVQH